MFNFKGLFCKLHCILLCIAFGSPLWGNCLDMDFTDTNIQPEDTVFVYDTVFIYDTVWEYEYVYDTVWVYDTVFTNFEYVENLTYLEPIQVKFIHLSAYHYRNADLLVASEGFKKAKQRKVDPSWYYNFRIKQRLRKKDPKHKNNHGGFDGKLTLNPATGSFNPHIFSRGVLSFEPYFGVFKYQNTFNNVADNNLEEDFKNAIKNTSGFEYGLKANYNLFQFGAQLGLGIINLNEDFNYTHTQTFVDSTDNYNVFPDTTIFVDSTLFLDMVYYLETGLERFITIYDTTYQYGYDSTLYYTYDTTRNNQQRISQNRYRLIEIPLILSYEFSYSNTSYQLKVGGINQFFISTSGQSFDQNKNIIQNRNSYYTFYNIALYTGIGIVYDFSNNMSLTLDAYYKKPLRNFTKNYPIIIRRSYYGAHIGLRYRF